MRLAGVQEQEAAGDAAQDAGRGQKPQVALMAAQVAELGNGPPQVARAEGHGVGDVGGHGGKPHCHEHRKGDEGAAAGQGVHRAAGDGRQADEKVGNYVQNYLVLFRKDGLTPRRQGAKLSRKNVKCAVRTKHGGRDARPTMLIHDLRAGQRPIMIIPCSKN